MYIGDIIKVGLFDANNNLIETRIVKFISGNKEFSYEDLRDLLVGITPAYSDGQEMMKEIKAIPFSDNSLIKIVCDDSDESDIFLFKEALFPDDVLIELYDSLIENNHE